MLLGQAQAISYVEVYWLLAIVSVLMFFLSFLLAVPVVSHLVPLLRNPHKDGYGRVMKIGRPTFWS